MEDSSFGYANLSNLKFIEELYAKYLENPDLVDISWKYFFEGMQLASGLQKIVPTVSGDNHRQIPANGSIKELIDAYRKWGHLASTCNPLFPSLPADLFKELRLETYGFNANDLVNVVPTCGVLLEETATLEKLVQTLKGIYCSNIGVDCAHCSDEVQEYIRRVFEPSFELKLEKSEKLYILEVLHHSESFESFIHMKYPGQKRFSVEGGESLIPLLLNILETSATLNVREVILGMAHRGRLNVLANVLKKSYGKIFYQFEPTYVPDSTGGSGDVKYHLGLSTTVQNKNGSSIVVTLADNPSHLESVDPVVEGMTKAKMNKEEGKNVLPLLIHGDAAVAGQGVVYETLQLSQIDGYKTGGTIHVVINNQVGFTATEKEGRSTRYCTDIAKTFSAPVFHVNGDDPEMCYFVGKIAAEIRVRFDIDVFIEILCYRKYGHNEGDEPAFTLPKLYNLIKNKENVRDLYKKKLIEESVLTIEEVEKLEESFKAVLEEELKTTASLVESKKKENSDFRTDDKRLLANAEKHLLLKDVFQNTSTRLKEAVLKDFAEDFCKVPSGFTIHSKIQRLLMERLSSIEKKEGIDWGLAEYLAYASLLSEGCPIRISGQDSQRGTFSHRHAAIVDQNTGERYFPLQHLKEAKAKFEVLNSPLSEYAVLGFEFGYACMTKEGLTIWEAQFGDFANGAQITIDQYIASSEAKWGLKCGIVLLLPHGYEGMGPEHSSARIERYLQLCSCYNMHVIAPTRPSQVFHALRRQVKSKVQIPLVIFTPKALLRYAPSLSKLSEFTEQDFQEILEDDFPNYKATRVLICSGKVYYDLIEERKNKKAEHVAIIRIEQLYPFNKEKLQEILSKYSHMQECFFVQEEHSNMGAYEYLAPYIREILPDKYELCYVGRARNASPAAGSSALHQKEKSKLLNDAFKEQKNS